jgi:transposase
MWILWICALEGTAILINRLKQWRGIASRFHKKAHYFHASLTLASILIWLRT